MMPQPYNQTKQFKRFSIEESTSKTGSEDKTSFNDSPSSIDKSSIIKNTSEFDSCEDGFNDSDDKQHSVTDQTVESFGSVQALNLDTSLDDIQLDIIQSEQSFYCEILPEKNTFVASTNEKVRANNSTNEIAEKSAVEEMCVDADIGSYYVSVSHLELNTSKDDKSVESTNSVQNVHQTSSAVQSVQSPGTVSCKPPVKDDVCPAKPPKTPKTSIR